MTAACSVCAYNLTASYNDYKSHSDTNGKFSEEGTEFDFDRGVYMRKLLYDFKHWITVMLNTGIRHLITRNPVMVWDPE